jgi:hypothetical protein
MRRPEALDALLEAPFLPHLTHLTLSSTMDLGAHDKLIQSPALENLLEFRMQTWAGRPALVERFGTRAVVI